MAKGEHRETNPSARVAGSRSWNSPASKGASIGAGEVAGAGEHMAPGAGPGALGRRISGMKRGDSYSDQVGSKDTPKGMSIYREE